MPFRLNGFLLNLLTLLIYFPPILLGIFLLLGLLAKVGINKWYNVFLERSIW